MKKVLSDMFIFFFKGLNFLKLIEDGDKGDILVLIFVKGMV